MTPTRPQPGEIIHGKYRVLHLLAEGGMGSIYEARHEVLGTSVALKFLHPDLARRPGLVARFLQEARVSATIRSPHIVQVLDVEQTAQGAFLVMELLRGETLQAMMDRQRRLPLPRVIDIALQMLSGLDVAHNAGVVHRDLKPDNVFVLTTAQGPLVKLLDFGIAKLRATAEFQKGLTRPGVTMGTPEYMAPEQAFSADTVDARADLYALGVMMFEMLTGQRPVAGDEPKVIAQNVFAGRVIHLASLDPSLPQALVAAVHRAMAPMPQGRFLSAAEMQRALAPFAHSLSNAGQQAVSMATGSMSAWPSQPVQQAAQQHTAQAAQHSQPAHPGAGGPGPGGHRGSTSQMMPMTPAPHPSSPGPAQPAARQPGAAEAPQRHSSVPKTLPPDDRNAASAPTTAPRDPLPQALFAPHAAAAQAPAPYRPEATGTTPGSPPAAFQGGSQPGYSDYGAISPAPYGGSTAQASPYGGSTAQASAYTPGGTSYGPGGPSYSPAGSPYGPPAGGGGFPYGGPPAVPPPPRRKGSLWLVAALAALAGGLLVALLLVAGGRDTGPDAPPAATAPATPTVAGSQPAAVPPPALPTGASTPPPVSPISPGAGGHPGPAPHPGPHDAGAPTDAGHEAGAGLPPFPNFFDAGLPPMPSAFPTSITIPFPVPFPAPQP